MNQNKVQASSKAVEVAPSTVVAGEKSYSENKIQNKRQIYLWDENKSFYDQLQNKSRLINLLLKKYREENDV